MTLGEKNLGTRTGASGPATVALSFFSSQSLVPWTKTGSSVDSMLIHKARNPIIDAEIIFWLHSNNNNNNNNNNNIIIINNSNNSNNNNNNNIYILWVLYYKLGFM